MSRHSLQIALAAALGVTAVGAAAPPPAGAFNPIKPLCSALGFVSGALGKACSVAQNAGRVLSAGKKLLGGHLGGTARTLAGDSAASGASAAGTHLALAAVVAWVLGGAHFALSETANVLGRTTSPQLGSLWFSSSYWRVAGVAGLLTLPFLFAAAVQALIRSDLALLARAVLGYLPLAALAVGVAAPVTVLLLSASDELSAVVSSSAGGASGHFLRSAGELVGGITLVKESPFLVFFAGLLTVGAALLLWLELLMRASAVYVIVLMLPLAFVAMVWPARRIWAVRAVEVLVALIFSKFVIVAVLSLGGAGISQSGLHSVVGLIAGVSLLALGICSPWALLRLLPMAELASGAAGTLRGEMKLAMSHVLGRWNDAGGLESTLRSAGSERSAGDWAPSIIAQMRADHDAAATASAAPIPERQAERDETDTLEPDAGPLHTGTRGDPSPEPLGVPQFDAEDLALQPLVLGPGADWGQAMDQAGPPAAAEPPEPPLDDPPSGGGQP